MKRRKLTLSAGRLAAAAVAAVALVAVFAGSAGAAGTIDQQQPVVNLSIGGNAIGGGSQQMLGQTVTAGAFGRLVEVQVPAACAPGSDLLVEIRGISGDAPSSTVLASQLVSGSTLAGGGVFNAIDFSLPPLVDVGTQYAIVLSSTGSCGIFQGPAGDSYAGGNLFFDARPNPPGWVCVCSFPGSSFDLPFKAFVAPPSPDDLLSQLYGLVAGVGPGTSLPDKVALAQTYLGQGDVPDACSTLTRLVNEVKAQTGKSLTAVQAASLSSHARQIQVALGC